MAGQITLEQISKQAGVSRITCSRVLNGSRGRAYVSDAMRQRVLDAAQALGYRRSMTAAAIRSGRINAIGLIGVSADHALPRPLLWGVEEAAAARDLHLIISQLKHHDIDTEAQLPRLLREHATDGLLAYGLADADPNAMLSRRITETRQPLIRMDVRADVDCVSMDTPAITADATAQLIRLGHRRIALAQFATAAHHIVFDQQVGYQRAMNEAGLTTQLLSNPDIHDRFDHQQQFAHYTLRQTDHPTAIVACGRHEAAAFVVAALRLNLSMPDQLAIFGIAEEPIQVGGLIVTTAILPLGQLARTAVRMLCTKIEKPDRPLTPQILRGRTMPGQTA